MCEREREMRRECVCVCGVCVVSEIVCVCESVCL